MARNYTDPEGNLGNNSWFGGSSWTGSPETGSRVQPGTGGPTPQLGNWNITPGQTGNEWKSAFSEVAKGITAPGTYTPANLNWNWEGGTGGAGGGGGGNGGGGTAPGGGGSGSGVSTVNYSNLKYDPAMISGINPAQMGAYSDPFQNFNNSMFAKVAEFMAKPQGYTGAELGAQESQAADAIFGGASAEDNAMAQEMMRAGMSQDQIQAALNKNKIARIGNLANARTGLQLGAAQARREGEQRAIDTGMNFSQQQGALESQRLALDAEIQRANNELDLAVKSGNAAAINAAQQNYNALQAEAQKFNASAANERRNLGSQLSAQKSIARMGNDTDLIKAMNQMKLNAAQFGAGAQNEAGQFNIGNNIGYQNLLAQLGAAGANAGIDQQRYDDNFLLNMLGLQSGAWNNLVNQMGQNSQAIYGSNPNLYVDPTSGLKISGL